MKQIYIIAGMVFILSVPSQAQPAIKLDYFKKVPVQYSNCGALYTYDSVGLAKKKFLFAADFQNTAMININGKQVALLLAGSKTIDKINITTYNGSGYTVILSSKTDSQKKEMDLESGTLEIRKGNYTKIFRIHGQSACDPSTQEGNSK